MKYGMRSIARIGWQVPGCHGQWETEPDAQVSDFVYLIPLTSRLLVQIVATCGRQTISDPPNPHTSVV